MIFGEPDIAHRDRSPDGRLRVKVFGVDVFKPQTGEVRVRRAPEGIALLDASTTDYNEESFFVRHAYFLGANDPYKRAEDDAARPRSTRKRWASLHSRHLPARSTSRSQAGSP